MRRTLTTHQKIVSHPNPVLGFQMKILGPQNFRAQRHVLTIGLVPIWNFDGSSTGQAPGKFHSHRLSAGDQLLIISPFQATTAMSTSALPVRITSTAQHDPATQLLTEPSYSRLPRSFPQEWQHPRPRRMVTAPGTPTDLVHCSRADSTAAGMPMEPLTSSTTGTELPS